MISLIVPVNNEEESLEAFYAELTKEAKLLHDSYEIVFIENGSSDSSLELLKGLARKDEKVRIFALRNPGKSEALTFGFQKAQGNIIVTLDADLQDQPSEIKKLLEKQKKDSLDIVSGWRKDRKDKSKMIIISKFFNSIVGKLFGVHLHDYNCGLKVYTSEAAKSLRLYGGLHRFIPVIAYQQGFSIDEIPVRHEPRKFGKSKYGFSKIWKDLPDMFTMLFLVKYSKKPLHFFGLIGGLLFLAGISIFGYLGILWLGGESIGRRPLLIFSVLLMLAGLQIFFTGFLAELIINLHNRDQLRFSIRYSSDT